MDQVEGVPAAVAIGDLDGGRHGRLQDRTPVAVEQPGQRLPGELADRPHPVVHPQHEERRQLGQGPRGERPHHALAHPPVPVQ
jgi:hypothetical protein